MEPSRNIKYYNELDDQGQFEPPPARRKPAPKHPARKAAPAKPPLPGQEGTDTVFEFSYKAARFEQGWLQESLAFLYGQHWISDVLRKIKAGKEASVYLCRAGAHVAAPLLAVKVYRPRMLRNLKNDNLYREGRAVLDEDGHPIIDLGMLKAEHKRSVYGEQIRHQSWITYEFQALEALQAAGADVPRAYAMSPNAILMDYLGDAQVAAPTLNSIRLEPDEVAPLFERLLGNLRILLAHRLIHADLSAYNLLYWQGQLFLIDFPQAVSPLENRSAYAIFERDVRRVCEYFAGQGLRREPRELAAALWKEAGYRLRPEVNPRFLDANDSADRRLWNRSQESE